MKLRWSNGHSFSFEFEANDPDSFYEQALSALRSFRISRHRRVHRGEIHKTVIWCEGCSLSVYDDDNRIWYYPEGESTSIETKSFGVLGINRHFDVRFPFVEANSMDSLYANYKFDLVCLDPSLIEPLDLSDRATSDRVWNLCYGVYEHGQALHTFVMSIGDVIDKHLENEQENGHE